MNLKNSTLIVIDMQIGNFDNFTPIFQGERLLENTSRIIYNCRKSNLPIIFIQNMGGKGDPDEPFTDGWKIHSNIIVTENDHIIQKTTPDAFYKTNFSEILHTLDCVHLIIVGLQTEYCIDTTVRRAYSNGFQITLVADCHSTWDSSILSASQIINHHNQVLNGFFADLTTVEDLCYALSRTE